MVIRNKQNFGAGLFFVGFGSFCAIVARGYPMGSGEDIGPGHFPFWLGTLLAVLGTILCASATVPSAERNQIGPLSWKSVAWIVGAVTLFATLLQHLGVVLSVIVLVVVSSLGSHEHSWKGALASALILATMVYAIFVKGLHLQFPAWPTFFS